MCCNINSLEVCPLLFCATKHNLRLPGNSLNLAAHPFGLTGSHMVVQQPLLCNTGIPCVAWSAPGLTGDHTELGSRAGGAQPCLCPLHPHPTPAWSIWGHCPVPELGTSPGNPGSALCQQLGQRHPHMGQHRPLGHPSPTANITEGTEITWLRHP